MATRSTFDPPPEWALVRILAEASSMVDLAPRLLEVVARSFDWEVGELWLSDEGGLTLASAGT